MTLLGSPVTSYVLCFIAVSCYVVLCYALLSMLGLVQGFREYRAWASWLRCLGLGTKADDGRKSSNTGLGFPSLPVTSEPFEIQGSGTLASVPGLMYLG